MQYMSFLKDGLNKVQEKLPLNLILHLEFVLLPHYDFIRRMLCGMDFSRVHVRK